MPHDLRCSAQGERNAALRGGARKTCRVAERGAVRDLVASISVSKQCRVRNVGKQCGQVVAEPVLAVGSAQLTANLVMK